MLTGMHNCTVCFNLVQKGSSRQQIWLHTPTYAPLFLYEKIVCMTLFYICCCLCMYIFFCCHSSLCWSPSFSSDQMILSFELPFALVPLLKFTSCKTKMGTHVNSTMV